ncbi:hypothetical protein [Leptolyngbya sp. FACHB-16]|uniref:hypothetical protein n=1 Tax=unclassified Leptolyngbya TaxID=2650499 RepID=UPI00168538B0|nr:hypothetical protein [Leptolyngbya sp. FACHB-16]MBD1911055.1 hypothetical protein [Leptolyngbya sp. FACHB-8]MBD2158279.1 hypothetical protein [Leptolyngbya sp. FACHB-16]
MGSLLPGAIAIALLPNMLMNLSAGHYGQVATAETQILPAGPGVFLPDFPTFNSELLDQQLYLYGNYVLSNGPPDVLVVGSSRALQGVDPAVLQQALVAQGLTHVDVYNFSINGATAQAVDFMVRQLLAPEQLPRLIIWADGSRAFNSAREDLTFNGIATSPGYRQVMAGDRPIPVLPPVAVHENQDNRCVETAPMAMTSEAALPLPCVLPGLLQGKDFPVTRTLTATLSQPTVLELTDKGFNAVPDEYNPATYFQRFPRVAGQYDNNYSPFQLAGVQTDATLALARYLSRQRIPLVFVSLPLHRDHFDNFRLTREQQFRQHMQQLATQGGFVYRDLSRQWDTQPRYFQDPSHLNRNGARAVAEYLATDPSIPWRILVEAETAAP